MIRKLPRYLKYVIKNTRRKIKVLYYRSICGSIGKNVNLYEGIRVHFPENLFVGDNVAMNNDVWIAALCVILPGVRIGRGSVVGAGAVVTHDIPPYSIATGVPATVKESRKNKNSTQST